MKYLILSDIHGSVTALQQVLDYYDAAGMEGLVLLGDLLYYGPRNGLPTGHDAPAVAEMLAARADKILACRGNCDSEVDQMMLPFPIRAPYIQILTPAGHRLFCTHGHLFTPEDITLRGCDAFLFGHTHRGLLEPADPEKNLPAVLNTGSPTFPKGGTLPSFATLEATEQATRLTLRDLSGAVLKELTIQK